MTAPETLVELAERIEKATGPDRELNRLIFATFQPNEFADAAEAAQYADPAYRGNNADWYYLRTLGMPAYTSSLDAAKTLYLHVPERIPADPRKAAAEGLRQHAMDATLKQRTAK